ncbi:hypothetical protein [Tenacibaculum aquimarinum]|uniref:hypothetical protein n=1 Tax=Tenacibaculum aquimarinum TaxID=2910675 RepID=UPI001F0A5F75|nr:hypothetical protein [Tenacibaculum aquimarinum]MCH3884793.1 hypothetical protein [Tenacibaculum aquimarinum]
MYVYLAVLKENVVLNKDVLSYFADMNFTLLAYYPKLGIIKIDSAVLLEDTVLNFISSIEQEKTIGL